MMWQWNRALRYWFASDGVGGEWRVYPFAGRLAFLDHWVKAGYVVRVGWFGGARGVLGGIRLAQEEAGRRQSGAEEAGLGFAFRSIAPDLGWRYHVQISCWRLYSCQAYHTILKENKQDQRATESRSGLLTWV
jgi:hypothetical protein